MSGDSEPGTEHHHRDLQGGAARAAIFGINDGLVSNTAIILGVVGAHPGPAVVRLVGISGMLAGSFSMAAGEYISMNAQRELYERELELEASELINRPESAHRELRNIYESRGVDPELADILATNMMRDPDQALRTHAREELGINPENLGSPWQASIASLFATAIGGFIPLSVWFILSSTAAVIGTIVSVGIAALLVGVALGKFTGRSLIFSGIRQLMFCGLAAGITYGIGHLVGISGIG